MNIKVLYHSSIKIEGDINIYFDPFKIKEVLNDADVIFITHEHYDHFSPEDILKIKKENTIIILPESMQDKALELGFEKSNIVLVIPNEKYVVENKNLLFETIPAYNINKNFHKKEMNWVGYILNIEGKRIYVAGDTDITEENQKVKCDIALVPIGGTYTMEAKEAAKLINIIKPKIAIPMHYGAIVGSKEDEEIFVKNVEKDIECKILLKLV